MENKNNGNYPLGDRLSLEPSAFDELDLPSGMISVDNLNKFAEFISRKGKKSATLVSNNEKQSEPENLINFSDQNSSSISTFGSTNALTVIDANALKPKSVSVCSTASIDILNTAFRVDDSNLDLASEQPRFNSQFKWVDKSRRLPDTSTKQENQSQIEWIKKCASGDASSMLVINPVKPKSPRRAVLLPEGPSYGFCEVPSLSKPEPPTVVVYESLAQPDRVFRNEEGTTIKVIKLEDIPKEKQTISPQRKKREIVKLVDTFREPERPKRKKESAKPKEISRSASKILTDTRQSVQSHHSLWSRKCHERPSTTIRTSSPIKNSPNLKDENFDGDVNSLLKKIEKLKEETFETRAPPENDHKGEQDQNLKENLCEEKTAMKSKSAPLRNINFQYIADGGDAVTNHVKRTRSYDPQMARDYIKKKRAERAEKSGQDQVKKLQILQEKKNKLIDLRKSQIKALKSCVKRKPDEHEMKPEWVGVLEKEDSESEPSRGGFGTIRKPTRVFNIQSEKALKIGEVKEAFERKKKLAETKNIDEEKLKKIKGKVEAVNTVVGSKKNATMISEFAQTEEVQDNRPDHNSDLIVTLSAQVKELSENIQSFKKNKRPVSPLKVTDTGVQVGHQIDKGIQIGNFPKRQKINLLNFKGTSSKGVQVVPTMMTEIENKSKGKKSEWLREMQEQTQPANLINTVKRKLNYYLRLDEERTRSRIPKVETPLSIEDLKLDFSRSSVDTKSKSETVAKEASLSLPDNSFKSVVASLALNTKHECSLSGSIKSDTVKPVSSPEQNGVDNLDSYIDLNCTEVDKEEAMAIFEPVKSDTMKSVSEINAESKSGHSSNTIDTISSHCGSIENSSGVTLSVLQNVDAKLENQQPFESSEILLIHSELSKSCPNIMSSKSCVPSQITNVTEGNSQSSVLNLLSTRKESSSTSSVLEVINTYRSTEVDRSNKSQTLLPIPINLSLVSSSSKSKSSIKHKVGNDFLIKSEDEVESLKEQVKTAASNDGCTLMPTSPKSVTTISECLSADPLKLPSSINELKLSETYSKEFRSKTEDKLIQDSRNGSIVSNSVASQTKVENTKLSISQVGCQDTDGIEHYTEPSNNTATFSPGSLKCRIEGEMNRLNALKLCLNTAIDRNKSLASRNDINSFKNDMNTISVTELVTSKILEENQSGESEVSTVSIQKSVTLSTNTSSLLAKLRFPEKLKVDYSTHKESTDDTDMSVSKFSLNMFTELVKDEELRFKHQSSLLKLRGKTLFEKTAAELAWLELQRRKEKEKGNDEIVKNIRKKQRGILLKYQEDIDEIKKVFKTEKTASKKRQLLFLQQQQVAKLQTVAKQYSEKKTDDLNKVSRISVGQSSSRLIAAEKSRNENTYLPKYLSESCLEKQKRLLEEREATLKVRKEAVEGLVAWKKRLEHEEKRVREMEKMISGLTPYVSYRSIDRATSPFPGAPESLVPSVNGNKSIATNSSVSEDLQSQKATSLSQSEVEELPKLSKAIDYYSDSSRLSSAISEHLMSASFSNNEKGSLSGDEKRRNSMVAIKIPLSPRVSRTQRRHSSGSDESILFSQNDTQSEQSDMEVRVCALQQQLRQRKAELERLKRERTKTQRERLRAKEQSLLNQIQAYDAYIERVKTEIKRELDACNVKIMKPQIKQPKVAERRKSDLWLPTEKKKDDSENSSVETVQSPVQKGESSKDSTYMSEDIEQESSENTESVKTFLESSTFPQRKEREGKCSGRSASVESVSAQRSEEVSNITEKLDDFEEVSECKTVSCSESNSEDKIIIQTDVNETCVESPTLENDISGDSGEINTISSEYTNTLPPSECLESNQKVNTHSIPEVSLELLSIHSMTEVTNTKQTISDDDQEQDNRPDCEPVAVNEFIFNEDRVSENEYKYEESFCEETPTNACSLPPSSFPCVQELNQECDETNVDTYSPHHHLSPEHHEEDNCVESRQIITEEIDYDQVLTDNEIVEELSCKSGDDEVEKFIEEIEAYELDNASEHSFTVDTEHEIVTGTQKTDLLMTEHEVVKEEQESEVEERQPNSLCETDHTPKIDYNEIQDKEMLASHITDEIMLNILYESFAISEKLWKNNYSKVLTEYNKVSEDTPLLKALQDENKENNSRVSTSATVNVIADKICDVCVEEASEAALKAYFKKSALHSSKVVESTGVESTSPVSEVKFNKKVGENEGNWLGEEFTAHTSKEAEELRLQQLQIEQEIEELEQATHQVPYYYVREIPNKPPPPYTPPKKAPSKEEVVSRVVSGVSILWEMFVNQKIDIASVEMPADYLAQVEDRMYREFMFDLSRELFLQYKNSEDSIKVPPWQKRFPKKRVDPPIRTKDDLIKLVERQVKVIFGFEPKSQKEKLIIRWSRKKRDHVDEILVRESQEEESEWTDFSVEENILKNEVADSIINKVLHDAVDSLIAAFNNKFKSDTS